MKRKNTRTGMHLLRINLAVLALGSSAAACQGCEQHQLNQALELKVKGVVTCVNIGESSTCFGGLQPELWDGAGLPDVPILFHRPDKTVAMVAPYQICLEDGTCYGDARIGSLAAAEVVLQPIDMRTVTELAGDINIVCWRDTSGEVECRGEAGVRPPQHKYKDIVMDSQTFCGSVDGATQCESLLADTQNEGPGSLRWEGYERPQMSETLLCARKINEPGEVRCRFEEGPQITLERVKEYGAGELACFNFGKRVECRSKHGDVSRFDVEVHSLAVGTNHFCGITTNGELLCRYLNDKIQTMARENRQLEFLSLESWKEVHRPRPKISFPRVQDKSHGPWIEASEQE